jgi:hypothetical protein
MCPNQFVNPEAKIYGCNPKNAQGEYRACNADEVARIQTGTEQGQALAKACLCDDGKEEVKTAKGGASNPFDQYRCTDPCPRFQTRDKSTIPYTCKCNAPFNREPVGAFGYNVYG